MNNDLNDVKIPKGATYKGEEVLKVLNVVVAEKAADSGYMLLLGNGDKEFITATNFGKLGEPANDDGEDA